MIELPGFMVYRELYKGTEKLDEAALGRLFRALMQYAFTGEEMPLEGKEAGIFFMAMQSIDKGAASYANRVTANQKNGMKGGRPRKQKPEETQENRKNPFGFVETQETQENRKNLNYNYNQNNKDSSSSGADASFMTEDEALEQQQALDSVYDAAQHAGFPTDQATLDKLTDMAAEYSPAWVLAAINEANDHTKCTPAYLRGILKSWKEHGGPTTRKRRTIARTGTGTPLTIMEGTNNDDI